MKASLKHAMARPDVKARTERTVKRRLKKELSKKIYTLPEARELQRLVQAKAENEGRNAVYMNIASKKVRHSSVQNRRPKRRLINYDSGCSKRKMRRIRR